MKILALLRISMICLAVWVFIVIAGNTVYSYQTTDSQDKEKKSEEPILRTSETIVVTATMTSKKKEDCPASVTVLTKKDLSHYNVNNVFNALSISPGIFIQRTGDFGRADVEIRGLGSNGRRISIMIDGRAEKMGLFGCVVTHSFSLAKVERIELIRGPASVLYGSDAMGGVVNIFTKRPEKRYSTDISISYGTYNSQHYLLEHGGNAGNFYYAITADRSISDGHLAYSSFDAQDYSFEAGYTFLNNFELKLHSKYFTGIKNEPGPITVPDYHSWNDYRRGSVDLNLKGTWQNSDIIFKVYRNYGHHQFSDGWNSKDYVQGGLIKYSTRNLSNNELTIGADYSQFGGELISNPRGKWYKNNAGFFINEEYRMSSAIILSAGFRAQHDSVYGAEWSAQTGFVFNATPTTRLRAWISRGFRFPQINELFMFPISNSLLKPEHVWNYEGGIHHSFAPWIQGEFTLFVMRGNNLIQTLRNPVSPPPFKFFNTGSFTYKGVETGMRLVPVAELDAQIYYSFLEPGADTRGKAKHKIDSTVTYHRKNMDASLTFQYVSDYYGNSNSSEPLPNYFMISGRINYCLNKFISIFTGFNNMLDEVYYNYVELPGIAAGAYLMPGKTFTAGLEAHF